MKNNQWRPTLATVYLLQKNNIKLAQSENIEGFMLKSFAPLRVLSVGVSALALSACVAAPKNSSSSSDGVSSSSTAISSSSAVMSSSSTVMSSSSTVMSSSSQVLSSSSIVMSSSSNVMSSSESSSSIMSSSNSSSMESSSSDVSSASSSSEEAGPPMATCELIASTNNGNSFDVEAFRIINSDTRQIDSWRITLDFERGNVNGYDQNVYADEAKQVQLAEVQREGNSLAFTIEGGVIDPMSTQNIYGFTINPAGIPNEVPECQLEAAVEGYDPTGESTSGLNGPGWDAVSQAELDAYFANYSCGVNYTGLGNGGWPACFRTEGGGAACYANGQLREIQWADDKSPVTNVRQISGMNSDLAVIVLDDGSAYTLKTDIGIKEEDQVVASGAIAVTAGFDDHSCLILDAGDKRDLWCTDKKKPWARPDVPADFDTVQVSSSYKFNCALNTKGEVWCWGKADAAPDVITEVPAQIPFDEPVVNISADQTTLCAVSYTGKPKCITDQFVPGYIPAGESIPGYDPRSKYLAEGFEPDAAFFHGAYNRGVVIRTDGTGVYYGASGGSATPLGLENIIAAGGKRDSIVVMTADGGIYSVNGGASDKVEGYTAENPVCPL